MTMRSIEVIPSVTPSVWGEWLVVYVDEVGQDLKGQNRKILPFTPKRFWNQDTSSVGSEVKGTSRVIISNWTLKINNSGNDSRPLQVKGLY